MARKSNQKKKGVENLQASNQTKRSSELNEEERDEHRNKAKPKRQPKKETNGTERPSPVETGPTECEEDSKTEATLENGSQENGSTRSPHFDKARFRTRTHRQSRGTFSAMMNRFSIHKAFERIELPDNEFTRSLRALTLSVLKASSEWLERQRQGPVFSAIRTKVETISGYVKTKAQKVYPVALKWLMSIGSVLFFILMVWLDCAVRGIDSFLRLGTTSFFSVVWFSLLSVLAMAGVFKCLVIFAIAGLIGAFVGLSLGILILGLSGAIFLWLYGSFWTTALVIFIGGLAYALSRERVALLITTVYSVYCAWTYVGWLGLVFGFNLAFVSSDILIYFLKNSVNQQRRPEQTPGSQSFNSQTSSEGSPGFSSDRSPGTPSTSGTDAELTSEDEIVRLLNCADHYSALGLTRFENVDISLLKREYRKKAMLVHPDKNMGNEKAAEAFKKLQNAYEVLLDSAKQKAYDDELRKDELLNYFRRFQSASQMSGGGHSFSGADGEDPLGESRRIACKKCSNFHVWVLTRKSKSQARFCQECNEFHPAKDGDGWVEQSSQPFLFGLMQKLYSPSVFVCADSKIYDATEWYICQGMRCQANTHKPSFQVNTSIASKYNNNSSQGKGTGSGQRGAQQMPPNGEEEMSEEEFFEWLQSAVQAGVFENLKREDPKTPPSNNTNNKRKKKGKKPW